MNEYEKSQQIMDDDGAGSATGGAITSVPAGQGWAGNPDNACAANGVTSSGRAYHYSAAHNGYVFDRPLPDPVHHGDIFSRIEASVAGQT